MYIIGERVRGAAPCPHSLALSAMAPVGRWEPSDSPVRPIAAWLAAKARKPVGGGFVASLAIARRVGLVL